MSKMRERGLDHGLSRQKMTAGQWAQSFGVHGAEPFGWNGGHSPPRGRSLLGVRGHSPLIRDELMGREVLLRAQMMAGCVTSYPSNRSHEDNSTAPGSKQQGGDRKERGITMIVLMCGITMLGLIAFPSSNDDIKNYIEQLGSKDSRIADNAVAELFKLREKALRPLLDNAKSISLYHGHSIYNQSSSKMQTEEVTVGVASLYLVEVIIRDNLHFALNPVLLREGERFSEGNKPQTIKMAEDAYRRWYQGNGNLNMKAMREKNITPLDGTNIYWYGQYWKGKRQAQTTTIDRSVPRF